jgi:RNA 2',3'-cyclic 3'-phosphodiesterase
MRLFVGVAVGEEVRAAVARARARIDAGLQQLRGEPPRLVWVAPQALHLTLRFLGEQPDARAAQLVAAIEAPFPVPPFIVTWHGLGAFPSPRHPRAIWLGVAAGARQLGELEREVARRAAGLAPDEELSDTRPFHPHLTLARVKTESTRVNWPSILADAAVSDVSSPVTHVTLFRSRGLPGGAGYEELGHGSLDG